MSQHDSLDDAIERLEWDDARSQRPASPLAQFTRRAALTGGAAGITAMLLEACGASGAGTTTNGTTGGEIAAGIFDNDERLRFAFINHLAESPVFIPTRNGAADACRLLGCTFTWSGSRKAKVTELVDAIGAAISSKVNGIATTLIDQTAFTDPVEAALNAHIPVVSYNSDITGNPRLAYIGEDLFLSGQMLAQEIIDNIRGTADIALFIALQGSPALEPRVAGARSLLQTHANINLRVIPSGPTTAAQLSAVEAYMRGHPTYRGFFGVDGGSTAAIGQVIQKLGAKSTGTIGGGFDLMPATAAAIKDGYLEFAIDQQLYMQGFLPVLELYLYTVSDKLVGIADVDTGIRFVTRKSVGSYADTRSRFEGSGVQPGIQST